MNLIVCFTPFQVLLAEKIISCYPNEKFYGFLIEVGKKKNKKYQYYYKYLTSICESEYLYFNNSYLLGELYSNLYMRFKYLFLPDIEKIFLANIQSDIIFMLLSGIRDCEIFTFDDGIGSLIDNSRYNFLPRMSLLKKTFHKLINNKFYPKDIISLSKRHFTIYKYMNNFKDKLEYINLIDYKYKNTDVDFKKSISIFIGQPIYESIVKDYEKKNIKLTSDLIRFFNIENYFPHPRENYIIDNVNYIDTEMIFEDYILNEIDLNPHIKYDIYTFLSGAALNLIDLPNVSINCIKPDNLNDDWYSLYSLFSKLNNINLFKWEYKD